MAYNKTCKTKHFSRRLHTSSKRLLWGAGAAAFWLCVWMIGYQIVKSPLLLPSPWQTLTALMALGKTAAFWLAVASSLARILLGFLIGLLLGVFAAGLSHRFAAAEHLLAPAMGVMKAAPVASFIILANLWLKSGALTCFIAGLMVLPLVWRSTLEGLRGADPALAQMAKAYRLTFGKRLRFLTLPALMPALRSAVTVGMGFAWKAGVAAEVIVLVSGSVGEGLYNAKVNLETPTLFAYTAVTVLVSVLLEKLLLFLLSRTGKAQKVLKSTKPQALQTAAISPRLTKSPGTSCPDVAAHTGGNLQPPDEGACPSAACNNAPVTQTGLHRVSFCYDAQQNAQPVVLDTTLLLPHTGLIRIPGVSGAGKTTTLLLLAGLLTPDAGQVQFFDGRTLSSNGKMRCADCAVPSKSPTAALLFQEDRLIGNLTLAQNVALVLTGRLSKSQADSQARQMLAAMGLSADADKKSAVCSGGMNRRCALARALAFSALYQGMPLLLDEPFSGVDEPTKQQLYPLILQESTRRPVVLVTHLEEEARALGRP